VELLEEENTALTEGQEETVPLSLLADNVRDQTDVPGVLRAGLESISVLKDIRFCACLSLQGRETSILQQYASLTEATPKRSFRLSARMAEYMRGCSRIPGEEDCAETGIRPGGVLPFAASRSARLLIPFRSRAIPNGPCSSRIIEVPGSWSERRPSCTAL
jgi:hypothetical protein